MALMVSINGSPRKQSRTGELIDAVCCAISNDMAIDRAWVRVAENGRRLSHALTRDDVEAKEEGLLRLIEGADLLVVGSPVYRASYTGLLKHLFDLVDRSALKGCKAVLVASGGTPAHQLMLEHQLRPLMGFFGIMTAPSTLYALEGDLEGGEIVNLDLRARLSRVAAEAVSLMTAHATLERGSAKTA